VTGALDFDEIAKRRPVADAPCAAAPWIVKPSTLTLPVLVRMRSVPALVRPVPPPPSMIVDAAPEPCSVIALVMLIWIST
jgi:hypothetical protein